MTAKQKKFITSLEVTNDIGKSCISTGITKRTFYNWVNKNEEFKKRVEKKGEIEKEDGARSNLKSMFLSHYKENLNISSSCDLVGVSRGTFYNWVKNDEEFKFNIGSVNEGMIDLAESVIKKAMAETNSNGTPTKKAVDTARFILSQKGIKRGWGEKIQTEVILTPYEKVMEIKRQARDEIIDITPEEMREMVLEELESDSNNKEEEYQKEKDFIDSLSELEKKEYMEDGELFMKNKFFESLKT